MNLPLISVVVATYNRADLLARALNSLSQLQSHGQFQMEIVVVDNASTDRTQETVIECNRTSRIPIRCVREPRGGLPFARNRGIAESRGEWVAYFDDDQLADPDWLWSLYNTAQDKKVSCVSGSRSLLLEPAPSTPLSHYCRYLLGEIDVADAQYHDKCFLPCTGNVIIEKKIFDTLGTFDENVLDGGEDSDFFNRMIQQKIPIYYEPNARVQHIIAAHRLQAKYLTWVAFRHGLHVGRRDVRLHGKLVPCSLVLARMLHAACILAPIYFFASLTLRSSDAVGYRCRLHRSMGYARFISRQVFSLRLDFIKAVHRGQG